MPRFALLYHDCPPAFGKPSHWDLMLERDGALLTWSLPTLPAAWLSTGDAPEDAGASDEPMVATRLADHRIAYLDYEGPISGDRGVVTRHDHGEYEVLEESPEMVRVHLRGVRYNGVVTLRR